MDFLGFLGQVIKHNKSLGQNVFISLQASWRMEHRCSTDTPVEGSVHGGALSTPATAEAPDTKQRKGVSLFALLCFALLCFTRPPRIHVLILLVISKRLGVDLRMNQSEDLDTEHDDGLWFACTVLRRTPPLSL